MVLLFTQNRKTSKGSYLQKKNSNLLGKRDWNKKFEINHYLAICVLPGTHPILQLSCSFQKLSLSSWVSINTTQFLLGLLLLWSFNFGLMSSFRQDPYFFLSKALVLHASVLLSVCFPSAAIKGLFCTWKCAAVLRERTNTSLLFFGIGGTNNRASRSGHHLSLRCPDNLVTNLQFYGMRLQELLYRHWNIIFKGRELAVYANWHY